MCSLIIRKLIHPIIIFLFPVSFPQNELIFTDILRLSVSVSASEDQDGGQPLSLDGKRMLLLHIRYQISQAAVLTACLLYE